MLVNTEKNTKPNDNQTASSNTNTSTMLWTLIDTSTQVVADKSIYDNLNKEMFYLINENLQLKLDLLFRYCQENQENWQIKLNHLETIIGRFRALNYKNDNILKDNIILDYGPCSHEWNLSTIKEIDTNIQCIWDDGKNINDFLTGIFPDSQNWQKIVNTASLLLQLRGKYRYELDKPFLQQAGANLQNFVKNFSSKQNNDSIVSENKNSNKTQSQSPNSRINSLKRKNTEKISKQNKKPSLPNKIIPIIELNASSEQDEDIFSERLQPKNSYQQIMPTLGIYSAENAKLNDNESFLLRPATDYLLPTKDSVSELHQQDIDWLETKNQDNRFIFSPSQD